MDIYANNTDIYSHKMIDYNFFEFCWVKVFMQNNGKWHIVIMYCIGSQENGKNMIKIGVHKRI